MEPWLGGRVMSLGTEVGVCSGGVRGWSWVLGVCQWGGVFEWGCSGGKPRRVWGGGIGGAWGWGYGVGAGPCHLGTVVVYFAGGDVMAGAKLWDLVGGAGLGGCHGGGATL